jgi:hypothetical protein
MAVIQKIDAIAAIESVHSFSICQVGQVLAAQLHTRVNTYSGHPPGLNQTQLVSRPALYQSLCTAVLIPGFDYSRFVSVILIAGSRFPTPLFVPAVLA